MRAPALRARGITRVRVHRELPDHRDEEPCHPHALALAVLADPIHAIVPVTGAEQRQAVRAHRQAGVDRPCAMLEQRARLLRRLRCEEIVGLVGTQRLPGEKRHLGVQHRRITRQTDVVRDDAGQPQPVVDDARADPGAGRRQPPVLHVAGDELPAGRTQQVFPRDVRARHAQRHHILQLVPESVRAARLVERGTSPHAARQHLPRQPVVDEQVGAARGCCDRERAARVVPENRDFGELRIEVGGAPMRDVRDRVVRAAGFAEQHDQLARRARRQRDPAADREARIDADSTPARRHTLAAEGRRNGRIAGRPEECAPVAGPESGVGEVAVHDAITERCAPRVVRQQRPAGGIAGRDDVGAVDTSRRPEREVEPGADVDPPRAARHVAQREPRDLDRTVARHEQQQRGFDAIDAALESRVADAVARHAGPARANRLRGRGPYAATVGITQVDHFGRRIGDRIVQPRRDAVLLAVDRPGMAAPFGRRHEAEIRIGDDVRPRRGGRRVAVEANHVFASVIGETAVAIVEFECGHR